MYSIGQRDIELGPRDVAGPWEVYLPQGLFGKPLFRNISRDLGCGSQLFDGGQPFPVPPGAVVDIREFGLHVCVSCVYISLQEAKGRIAKGKCARANEQQFAILLLRTGFVVVRELGFLGEGYLCPVCLVVESQGLVGVFEIVKRLILFPILLCNPVQKLCAILLVLCIVSLILFKGKVMPFLFIQCSLAAVTRKGFCEIVAADESGRIENGPTNHDSDRSHCVYTGFTHLLEVSSDPPGISSGRCCQP